MSLNVNPLLYINMGGEMIYVIHQRLRAQKVDADKSTQVLNEITGALLNSNNLSVVFDKKPNFGLSYFRGTLESVVLSSVLKLDDNSMNKLFDLMMMMVKYQLTAATGPREVILITLNHIDALREMVTQSSQVQENIGLIYKLLIDMYGKLIYDEIWDARNECLNSLNSINVRVSILLRLGLQNEDTTFNIKSTSYNENFQEHKSEIGKLNLIDYTSKRCDIGSLQQINGDRVTQLGKNIYLPSYGKIPKTKQPRVREKSLKNRATKAELGMLAVQLGTEDNSTAIRPFSLNLFDDEIENLISKENSKSENKFEEKESAPLLEETTKIDADYKAKLDNFALDLYEDDDVNRKINILQLLDEAE